MQPAPCRSNELHHVQLLIPRPLAYPALDQTVTTFIPSDLALAIIASSRQRTPCALRLSAIARCSASPALSFNEPSPASSAARRSSARPGTATVQCFCANSRTRAVDCVANFVATWPVRTLIAAADANSSRDHSLIDRRSPDDSSQPMTGSLFASRMKTGTRAIALV